MELIILMVITAVAVIAWGLCLSRVSCPLRSTNAMLDASNDNGSVEHEELAAHQPRQKAA